MHKTMSTAIGIGLSANQIGLNLRLFVAQISHNVSVSYEVLTISYRRCCVMYLFCPLMFYSTLFLRPHT